MSGKIKLQQRVGRIKSVASALRLIFLSCIYLICNLLMCYICMMCDLPGGYAEQRTITVMPLYSSTSRMWHVILGCNVEATIMK